jgi:peptidoglycan/LPS O-acetylase OafA/YrhL
VGLGWAIATAGVPRGGFPEYHWLVLLRVGLAYVLGILLWRLWGDSPPVKVPFAIAFAALPAYVGAVWLWPWDYAPLVFVLVLAPLMMLGGISASFRSPMALEAAIKLGALSFPLYALHYPAIRLLRFDWGWLALAAIALVVLLWRSRVGNQSIISRMAKARPVLARKRVQLQ